MEDITIEIGGIIQTVNAADLPLYTRAGYKIVNKNTAPVEPVVPPAPVVPDPELEPAPVEPEAETAPEDKE